MTLTARDVAPGEPGSVVGEAGPRAGQPFRRTFTSVYKLRIVDEYFALTEHGARGALLRREGLYQSHVDKWRRARDRGLLTPSDSRSRAAGSTATDTRIESGNEKRLRLENARLAAELAKTKAVLDVVGKAHALLEILSEGAETERQRPR